MRNKISDLQNALPEDAGLPVVRSFETGAIPIMTLNVSGNYDQITLKNIAEDLQKAIQGIDGVKEVTMVGGLEREINIYVDPAKLATANISINEIKNAVTKANINAPGGNLELDDLQFKYLGVAYVH